jgi:hypothetical protein
MGNVFQCQNVPSTLPDYSIDDYLEAGFGLNEIPQSFIEKAGNKHYTYDHGYNDGYDDGYEVGQTYGIKCAYNEGYTEGVKDGKSDGNNEGYRKGYDEGYVNGFKDSDKQNEDFRRKYVDLLNKKDDQPGSDAYIFSDLIKEYMDCFLKLQYAEDSDPEFIATVRSTMIDKVQQVKTLIMGGYTFNKVWLFAYDETQMALMFMQDFMHRPAN